MPIGCPQCGAQNPDTAQNCYACGYSIFGQQQPYGGQYGGQPQTPYAAPPAYGQQPYAAPGYAVSPYQQGGYGASQLPYADPIKRFLAVLIDGVVVFGGALPGLLLTIAGGAAESGGLTVLGALLLYAGIFAVLIYNIYLLGQRGSSIGKKMMGLTCLGKDGQPIGFLRSLGRELLKGVLGNVCLLTHLWLLFDQEKQQLYDKVLETHVYQQ